MTLAGIGLGLPGDLEAKDTSLSPPAKGGEQSLAVASPIVRVLPNGLTVLVKKDTRFPLAAIRLYVHAGSAYEQAGQAGISHMLEHMVFKGTEKRAPGESAQAVESVGGSINAGTSFDYTVYHCELPSKHWKLGLDVLTDMAFHAKIDEAELATEKKVVLSELERGQDSPGSVLFKQLHSMVWNGTSYGWPIIGFKDTVEGIEAKDIKEYIAKLYQPQSMLLVAAGDLDPDEVLSEAQKLAGGLSNDQDMTPAQPIPLPAADGPAVSVIQGKWNKVYMALAFPVPGLGSGRLSGLEVLAQLLGGDETSRLYRMFKYERRLVDDISVSAMGLQRSGLFYVFATLDADKVDPFLSGLLEELAGLNVRTFSDAELERAKLNIEDSIFLAKETLPGVASKLGFFQFFQGGWSAEGKYLYSLGQSDKNTLASLARTYLRPEAMRAAVLVPEGTELSAEDIKSRVANLWPASQTATAQGGDSEPAFGTKVEDIDLPGGSRLVLLPDDTLPYAGLTIFWPGGDGLVMPEFQGLADLSSRVLVRGFEGMTATGIEDFLSDRASTYYAGAGRETFYVNAKYPVRFEADILDLVRNTLYKPTWDGEEVARAKQDQISAIRRRMDHPMGLAFRNLFPFLFKSGPYSYLHLGEVADIETFGPAEVQAYWDAQRAQPFTLAVCGQFHRQAMVDFATDLAKTMTTDPEKYGISAAPWNEEHEKVLSLPDRNQAHVLAVFPAPGKANPATPAMTVLRTVLDGQSGLLFRKLRDEQGLGYAVSASLWQAPHTGFLAFYIGTTPDKVDKAVEGFKTICAGLAEKPLPEAELDRAKNLVSGEYYMEHQSLLSRSREAASLITKGFSRKANLAIINKTGSVGSDDVREAAARYLKWDDVYIMKVLP